MSFVESRNGNPPRLSSTSTHRDHLLSKASRTVRLLFGEISRPLRRDVTCCASASSLRWLHTAVDLLLPVIALLGDPVLPAQLRDRRAELGLLQNPCDLLNRKAFPLHNKTSVPLDSILPQTHTPFRGPVTTSIMAPKITVEHRLHASTSQYLAS